MKVHVLVSNYNGVSELIGVYRSEKEVLNKINDFCGSKFTTIKEFVTWQQNEMTDKNEIKWFIDELE